jgi:hypothetical protein
MVESWICQVLCYLFGSDETLFCVILCSPSTYATFLRFSLCVLPVVFLPLVAFQVFVNLRFVPSQFFRSARETIIDVIVVSQAHTSLLVTVLIVLLPD